VPPLEEPVTRSGFQAALEQVERSTEELAELVAAAIDRAMTALRDGNADLAARVVREDADINARRYGIEQEVERIIATQQPVASDLRLLVAVLYVIVDLERMADHAEGIARIVLLHRGQPLARPVTHHQRMAAIATDMLRGSLRALLDRDAEAARRVADRDDEVDALTERVYRELIAFMSGSDDPSVIDRATYLIWAAHNLERIADRTTNICERAVYLVTGSVGDVNVSTY
jgi:phosphate transport system protein